MTSQKQLLLLILSSLGHIAERQFPGKERIGVKLEKEIYLD